MSTLALSAADTTARAFEPNAKPSLFQRLIAGSGAGTRGDTFMRS